MIQKATGHCEVCGKALGLRRAAQGVRRHPGCRTMLRHTELSQALERTQEVLDRMSVQTDDDELDPMLVEAARQARAVLQDLQRMKDYVAPPAGSGSAGSGSAGPSST